MLKGSSDSYAGDEVTREIEDSIGGKVSSRDERGARISGKPRTGVLWTACPS